MNVYVCSCECMRANVCFLYKQINPKMISQMRGEETVHTI